MDVLGKRKISYALRGSKFGLVVSGCTDRATTAPLLLKQGIISCVWGRLQYIRHICCTGSFMVRIEMSLLIIVDYIEHSRLYTCLTQTKGNRSYTRQNRTL